MFKSLVASPNCVDCGDTGYVYPDGVEIHCHCSFADTGIKSKMEAALNDAAGYREYLEIVGEMRAGYRPWAIEHVEIDRLIVDKFRFEMIKIMRG